MATTWMHPLKYMQSKLLLTLNLLLFCFGSVIAIVFKARFDGIFQIRFLDVSAPMFSMTDNLINIIVLTIVLFATGKFINPKTKMIDCLNTVFLSRIPFYTMCFANIGGYMTRFSFKNITHLVFDVTDLPPVYYIIIGAILLVLALMVLLSILILFTGFRTFAATTTRKQYLFFGLAIILAQVVTSIIIKNL